MTDEQVMMMGELIGEIKGLRGEMQRGNAIQEDMRRRWHDAPCSPLQVVQARMQRLEELDEKTDTRVWDVFRDVFVFTLGLVGLYIAAKYGAG